MNLWSLQDLPKTHKYDHLGILVRNKHQENTHSGLFYVHIQKNIINSGLIKA